MNNSLPEPTSGKNAIFKHLSLKLVARTVLPPLLLLALVAVAFWLFALPTIRTNLMEAKKDKLKELTQVTWSILDEYQQKALNGEINRDEAQQRALDCVDDMRYGPSQQNYLWINNMSGRMMVHPYMKQLEGRDMTDHRDPRGKLLFQEMLEVCRTKGSGFVHYHWQWHDNPNRIEPKISHVRRYKPWDWFIGTGIYINDVEKQIASITRTANSVFAGFGALILLISGFITLNNIRAERERSEARHELQEKKERLELVLHGGQLGAWDWDIPTNTVIFNDRWAEMLGYESDELEPTLEEWEKRVHPDDMPATEKRLNEHLEGRSDFYEAEFRMKHKCGDWIWIHDRGKVIERDDQGNPLRACGTHLDITERKRAEKELRENERQLRRAQSVANFGSWQFDLDANTVSASQQAKEIYGVSHDQRLTIDYIQSLVLPEYRQMMDQKLQKLVEGEEDYDIEFEMQRPEDGEIRYIHSVARYIPEENVVTGVIQDITERKRAKDRVIEERQRLEVTLRSIGDGVIATDTEGNVKLLNEVAEKHTGWANDEAEGQPIERVFNIVDEESGEQRSNPVRRVLSEGETVQLTNHALLISRNGEERMIADSAAPIRDKKDDIIGVVLVFRDVTERRRMEETRRRAAKLDSLGVLAGGIAHDFNNLLTSIYGYIELADHKSSDEEVSDCLEKSSNTIDRARHLTSQLLTYAEGGAPVKNVHSLIPFLRQTAQFALSGSNVDWDFDLPEDLWCCNFDKNQMGQVIDNVIINAQEAMPEGGTISISARNMTVEEEGHPGLNNGPYVKISIADSGVGIPQDMLSKIFDPFFTTKSEGHGLGLATCYSIVEKHGGLIDAESSRGEGTTFHIYLPATPEGKVTTSDSNAESHTGTGTLLVMDDEPSLREMLKAMLESYGYSVVCVADGNEALNYLRSSQPVNGMIFDMTIQGGMGGVEAVSKVREIDPDIPVIVASGYADDPVMSNPEEYGFTASVSKPFKRSELSAILNEHLA